MAEGPSSDETTEKSERRGLEGLLGDLLRRAIERGIEKAQDAPDNLRSLFTKIELPKEMAAYVLSQIEETKAGMLKVAASETRAFLERSNLPSELKKIVTSVKFEINTTVRFIPNENPPDPAKDSKDVKESTSR